jgi:predicted ATPase
VSLSNPCFLVGRNGAGKTNFVDGLRFVHDSLNTNLETSVASHGTMGSILTVGSTSVSFSVGLELAEIGQITYKFSLDSEDRRAYSVAGETLEYNGGTIDLRQLADGSAVSERVLSLGVVAGSDSEAARATYDALRAIRFYDFQIATIRSLHAPEQGDLLRSDGGNLPSVLKELQVSDPQRFSRLTEHMRVILPELVNLSQSEVGPNEGIQFWSTTGTFWATHMSTGTLYALAVLTALFQPPDSSGRQPSLVVLEEPERALHPAAVGVLFDAIIEASQDRQVLVTTQSPDLLDRKDVEADSIRVVFATKEGTSIGSASEAMREAISTHLFTAGELLRLDQLGPND